MTASGILTEEKYQSLLTDLKQIVSQGHAQARAAAGRELVKAYWEVGQRLKREQLTDRAGYGKALLKRASLELDLHETTLERALTFFKRYEISAPWRRNLSWAHYQELLPLADPKERNYYEVLAERDGWSKRRLREAIRLDVYGQEAAGTSQASNSVRIKRPTDASYLFQAEVTRVLDGDTLILHVDLGFEVWKEQRVRLAKIDCPPITTAKGEEATRYVLTQLAQASTIVIRTSQVDIHGRYVGDLFYDFKRREKLAVFRTGRYLNQELLDRGFAIPL